MPLDPETVRRIARLARIRLEESEAERLGHELAAILAWVEMLNSVDVTDVAPMTGAITIDLKMRPDIVTEGGAPELVLGNAPERAGDYYAVPKVIE
ncbi:MAG: Asp-tRNA(Asn)/Glu-tRNA(Gln) amidotransferase subunit GatC [Acetobacteraceae bacterium]